mgnify:CR=1 FL=1
MTSISPSSVRAVAESTGCVAGEHASRLHREDAPDVRDEARDQDDDGRWPRDGGTPRSVRKANAAMAFTEAIVAVPRIYPPARRIASSPAVHPDPPPFPEVPQASTSRPFWPSRRQRTSGTARADDDRGDAGDPADDGGRLGRKPGLDLRDASGPASSRPGRSDPLAAMSARAWRPRLGILWPARRVMGPGRTG